MHDTDHRDPVVIDRYVLGQLTDRETEAFELYFMDRPELIAAILFFAGV